MTKNAAQDARDYSVLESADRDDDSDASATAGGALSWPLHLEFVRHF